MTIPPHGHLESHATDDGHDHAECLAVVRKIRAGRWTDADRFRPLPDREPPAPPSNVVDLFPGRKP